jgi:hypothetical protein
MDNLGRMEATQHLQIVHLALCLPYISPKDMCMLRCTCSELRDMRVSWRHHSIDHKLDGSCASIAWLHKNIVSVLQLKLTITLDLPTKLLQDLLSVGR